MDIDISQLPEVAVEAVVRRHETVRVMRNGCAVASVVPAETTATDSPVFLSHKALRGRVGALTPEFAALLRQERDER